MHLRELELGLGAHSLREGGVADHVAKGLSVAIEDVSLAIREWEMERIAMDEDATVWSIGAMMFRMDR